MTLRFDLEALPRRMFLKAGAVALAASAVFSLAPLSHALAESLSQDAFADFMSVSQTLCGKQTLDPILAKTLFQALENSNPDFVTLLGQFKQWMSQRPQPLKNFQADLLAQHKELAVVPSLITSAWYLGVVGNQAFAYEQALMYTPVKDMVILPTFARGEPGYWEAKPYPLPVN